MNNHLWDGETERWLQRCRELAVSDLDGIEDAAGELAGFASGDRAVMERARRAILDELYQRPRDPVLRQMFALWRRAFEKGSWGWEEVGLVRSWLLS